MNFIPYCRRSSQLCWPVRYYTVGTRRLSSRWAHETELLHQDRLAHSTRHPDQRGSEFPSPSRRSPGGAVWFPVEDLGKDWLHKDGLGGRVRAKHGCVRVVSVGPSDWFKTRQNQNNPSASRDASWPDFRRPHSHHRTSEIAVRYFLSCCSTPPSQLAYPSMNSG